MNILFKKESVFYGTGYKYSCFSSEISTAAGEANRIAKKMKKQTGMNERERK